MTPAPRPRRLGRVEAERPRLGPRARPLTAAPGIARACSPQYLPTPLPVFRRRQGMVVALQPRPSLLGLLFCPSPTQARPRGPALPGPGEAGLGRAGRVDGPVTAKSRQGFHLFGTQIPWAEPPTTGPVTRCFSINEQPRLRSFRKAKWLCNRHRTGSPKRGMS